MAHSESWRPTLEELFPRNRAWAESISKEFFIETAGRQQPRILWIGCSDSRVPKSVILGCKPGAIFTHRNIANQVQLDDTSVVSVLDFAITQLDVEHVIVAGHTNCGGVAVCVDDAPDKARCFNLTKAEEEYSPKEPRERLRWSDIEGTTLGTWLTPVRTLAVSMQPTTVHEVIKANVKQQVLNVVASNAVRSSWASTGDGRLLGVHGWIYDLEDGLVQDLECSVRGPNPDLASEV